MYKTELHAHCAPISPCAHADTETLVRRYVEAGYSTVVLQNHFCRYGFSRVPQLAWDDCKRYFLSGYHELKKAAEGKLNILLGAEMRIDANINDYLIFGLTEEKLLSIPMFFDMRFNQLCDMMHEMDCLIFQAHPMRFGMTLMNPDKDGRYDGIEVYNSHNHHDSHNDMALLWAQKLGLAMSSGSDFHDPDGVIGGGIRTGEPIRTMDELMQVLKNGEYSLIKE